MWGRGIATVLLLVCVTSGCAVGGLSARRMSMSEMGMSAPARDFGTGIGLRMQAPVVRHVTVVRHTHRRDMLYSAPHRRDALGAHLDPAHPALRWRRQW